MKSKIYFLFLYFTLFGSILVAQNQLPVRYQSRIIKLNALKDSSQTYMCERTCPHIFNLTAPTTPSVISNAAVKYVISQNADTVFVFAAVDDSKSISDMDPMPYTDRLTVLFNVKRNGVDSIVQFDFPLIADLLAPFTLDNGATFVSTIDLMKSKNIFDIAIPLSAVCKNFKSSNVDFYYDLVYTDDDTNDMTENPEFSVAAFSDASINPFTNPIKYNKFTPISSPIAKVLSHSNSVRGNIFNNFEGEYKYEGTRSIHVLSQQIIDGDTLLCDSIDKTAGGYFPDVPGNNGSKYTALRYIVNPDEMVDLTTSPYIELKVKSDSAFIISIALMTAYGPLTGGAILDTVPSGVWKTLQFDFGKMYSPAIRGLLKFNQSYGLLINFFGFDPNTPDDDNKIKSAVYFDDIKIGNNVVLKSNLNTVYSEKLSLYPNPTKDYLNFEGLDAGDKVSIFDNTGRSLIKDQIMTTNSIDVSQLNPGFYVAVAGSKSKLLKAKFIKL